MMLEDVLKELGQSCEVSVNNIPRTLGDPLPWECTIVHYRNQITAASYGNTPLEAATECLNRYKESVHEKG